MLHRFAMAWAERAWLLACCLGISGCFYMRAAGGQLALINRQVPLQRAAAYETVPERRWMLRETPRVLRFARDVLLLEPGDSYRGYVHTEAAGLTFVVSASEATRFEPYTWWFPVAGEVAYKSHFDEADADAEAAALQTQGLDVWVSPSRAYSTLGLFRDPVVTTMMKDGPLAYVEVLLHELTHARLYVPGQTEFNEQLASFVATKGLSLYVRATRFAGTGAEDYVRDMQARQARTEQILFEAIDDLEALYARDLPRPEVLRLREPILRGLEARLVALFPERDPEELRMNNARLLQYQRYGRGAPFLEALWQKSGERFAVFWPLVEAHAENLPESSSDTLADSAR